MRTRCRLALAFGLRLRHIAEALASWMVPIVFRISKSNAAELSSRSCKREGWRSFRIIIALEVLVARVGFGLSLARLSVEDDIELEKRGSTMIQVPVGSKRRRTMPDESNQGDERQLTFLESSGDPLLPGIPNEITMAHIAPKLSWRDFYILSRVRPAWCQAIRSRKVYHARAHSDSTEMLILLSYVHAKGFMAIALYSMKDNCCYKLPLSPPRARKMPQAKEYPCVSLDGKVYIMGLGQSRADVYVFDVAGQRKWQKCANMIQGRKSFGCAVVSGKIYAFGGRLGYDPVCESEVYDPEEDTWTLIKQMPSLRYGYKVATDRDKIFVHSGSVFGPEYFDSAGNPRLTAPDHEDKYTTSADSLEVYHPIRDEWRVVELFHRRDEPEMMGRDMHREAFMTQGKLFSMCHDGIYVPIWIQIPRSICIHSHSG